MTNSLASELPGLTDLSVVGRGGFATVYRARQAALRREVAVKVLETPVGDAVARRRFERECAAMGLLAEHPHILTVFDAGFTSSRRAYLVMDLARRGSLADRLEREGSLPWQDVTALGIKMAGALETAHRAGILHRDVKPANILLTAYGEPQLADFGIARLAGEEHTRTGALAMSIAFAAPEVLDGREATVLTDVYSLGATLFCLLRGEPPFVRAEDESILPAVARILTEHVPDLRPLGIPDRLVAVVERALAKDPAGRFSSCEELALALRVLQREHGLPVTPLLIGGPEGLDRPAPPRPVIPFALPSPPRATPAPPPNATIVLPLRRGRHSSGRRREVGLVLLGVVALLTVGVVLLVLGTRQADAPAGAPTAPPPTPTATPQLAGLDPVAITASATSTLPPDGELTYGPGNTVDGDLQTAWNHGTGGDAAGEILRYDFANPVDLVTIGVVNGYAKSEELYAANHRLRDVVVRTDAGAFPLTLADTVSHQELTASFGITTSAEILVVTVYEGSDYDDLAVTEVDFTVRP